MKGIPYRLGWASGEAAWYAHADENAPSPFPVRSSIAWSSPAMEWEWQRGFLEGWEHARGVSLGRS